MINIKDGEEIVKADKLTDEEITNLQQGGTKEIKYDNLISNTTYTIEIIGKVKLGEIQEDIQVTYNYKKFTTLKIPAKVEIRNQFITGNLIDFDVRIEDINNSVLNNTVRMELRNSRNDLIDLQELTTNQDYIRKTYEKLEENQTYRLSFYADQYNEGSTDETYKVNYLIKEIEIVTEPGISGSIGLTELTRKATGKNLVDMSSEIKWYVYPNFNTYDYYGKEYNKETEILTVGGHSNERRALYDLRKYIGQEITMSFKARRLTNEDRDVYILTKNNKNRIKIEGLSTEWESFQYTLTVDETGYWGFYTAGGNGIEIQELQIELGNKKTSYEEFKYTLQSNYSINLEDRRNEITTNDYYIKVYEDNNLIKEDRYEEIPENNEIKNVLKTYETKSNKQYKIELVIKIKDREYVISELEYNTQDTEEIKGIYNKEDFLEIQARGHYIVLGDIDLSGGINNEYKFGSNNMSFEGTLDFNGHTLTRDAQSKVPIINTIGENGVIKNLNLDIKLNNEVEISNFTGFTQSNYGKIQNIKINLLKSTNVPNNRIYLLSYINYGIVDNFIINFQAPIYGSFLLTGITYYNEGTISNGYCYGENIKAIYANTLGKIRYVSPLAISNQQQGIIYNIFSLVSVDTQGATGGNEVISNIVGENNNGATIENIYSVGIGDIYDLAYGPNVYTSYNEKVNNSYYFNDNIFNNAYNKKTTELALYDSVFQNQIINSEGKFDIDNLIKKGYYPWLNMPSCMPTQEYIKLPEVEDKDLPDILSMEILETNNKDEAKIKIYVNNPGSETIKDIKIKNLECHIESQTYSEGKSEVIAIINNPTFYVSEYSVLSITTKGAYNSEYTREFKENERFINVDFYKEINSIQEWNNINKSPTENYILMTDLDFKNNSNLSRITTACKGKIDGNNHVIKNINLNVSYIIVRIENEFKNISFENCKLSSNNVQGIINTVYGKVENVRANNIELEITSNVTTPNIGGLIGVAINGANITNCSISNVSIKISTYSTTTRAGGLIGVANGVEINNCFVQNVSIDIKNNTYEGVGGLIGAVEVSSIISNCYATGNINTDGGRVSGLVAFINEGTIKNSFSYVNISGEANNIGGIVGQAGSGDTNLTNNIALGDLYTNAIEYTINRVAPESTNLINNFAYINQRVNGKEENETTENITLLSAKELQDKNTYLEKLKWNDIYNYTGLDKAILPKLNFKDRDTIMPYQNDIYLNLTNKFTLEDITVEKIAIDKIQGQVVLTNISKTEVVGIEIDGMQIDVKNITTRDGITYINFEGSPNKYYDIYKLTYIRYKQDENIEKEEIEGRIEIQFYKEIYTFEDWQTIEKGTYQNYRIMQDIDFGGRTNINSDITVARLEGVNENITLKNIDLPTNNLLINGINIEIRNLKFENIDIEFNNKLQNVGVISNLKGNMDNTSFKDITIQASTSDKVGIIGSAVGSIKNINLEQINIAASSYVGGFVGNSTGASTEKIDGIKAKDIYIKAKDYAGGVVGYTTANITNAEIENVEIDGNNYIGGVIGTIPSKASSIYGFVVRSSRISGNNYVGGIEGYIYGYGGGGNREIYDSSIIGIGKYIGGISGNSSGAGKGPMKVINCEIKGIGSNTSYVGGFNGYGSGPFNNSYIKDSTIETTGSYVGGFNGECGNVNGNTIRYNYVENINISGYSKVGGMFGNLVYTMYIYDNYINANILAFSSDIGGIIGYLDNANMTAVSNTSRIYRNYFIGSVEGKSNVGGFLGNIAKELYMPEENYMNNYFEVYVKGEDVNRTSIGIGGRKDQNQYLINSYFYKYSTINGQNPNKQNEIFISEDKYLVENELKQKSTYTSTLNWSTFWNYGSLENNKYPTLNNNNLTEQTGIDLPKDSEHIIDGSESSIEMQSKLDYEEPEQIFQYNNKQIQTYSTYSVITDSNGGQATRNAKLYVKDNNLYAIPSILTITADNENITPVEDNLIIDSYNGKEYETVLGSDGKLYDLKEPITYPEDFINENIESIGNNLNNDSHEVEVTYKNGDKMKFNYQTGEVISSSKNEESKQNLFEYIGEKLGALGEEQSSKAAEMSAKYEESQKLQTKLEETSVEEAIEEKNSNSNIANNSVNDNVTEETKTTETNNSLKENKYISMYNEETGQYEIYNEEELLDTSKEEVVSENEKIEANNLSEYYASEGETKNTKQGIVWIVISIIGVGIILFILKKNLKKKA